MKTITASDRSALIRLASSLPKGDSQRKAILAGLSAIDVGSPKHLDALQNGIKDVKAQIKRQEQMVTDLSDIASPLGPKVVEVYVRKEKAHLEDRKQLLKALEEELRDARSKKGKTARGDGFDFEGSDFGVKLWRGGPRDEINLYWPLENIGRRGRGVEVREVSVEGDRIAWGATFLDQVKKARTATQANAALEDLKAQIEAKGDRVWYDRSETVKGIDKSLPTPSMYRLDDIKGSDITIDLNAKPIEVYSESDSDKWRNAGNMTYWFKVHPRFKKKLALMREDLAAARGLDAVGKLLSAEGIPFDYHSYMMPGWD